MSLLVIPTVVQNYLYSFLPKEMIHSNPKNRVIHKDEVVYPHLPTFEKVHLIAEKWHALDSLAAVNHQINANVKILKDKLAEKIIKELDEIQKNETAGEIFCDLVGNGMYLAALKIYYLHKPENLNKGADGNILHKALERISDSSFIFIQFILDMNEKYNLGLLTQKNKKGQIPFEIVVGGSRLKAEEYCIILKRMLKDVADPKKLIDESFAIHGLVWASSSEFDFTAAIKLLASYGADLNQKDSKGAPLHYAACAYNIPEALRVLLELGADVYVKTDDGRDALEMCEDNLLGEYNIKIPEHFVIKKNEKNPKVILDNILKMDYLIEKMDEIPFRFLKYLNPQSSGSAIFQIKNLLYKYSKKINWLAKDNQDNNYLHLLIEKKTYGLHEIDLKQFYKWMFENHREKFGEMLLAKNKNNQNPYELFIDKLSKVDSLFQFMHDSDLKELKRYMEIYEKKNQPEPEPVKKTEKKNVLKNVLTEETFHATTCLKVDHNWKVVIDRDCRFDTIRNSWLHRIINWVTNWYQKIRLDTILNNLPIADYILPDDLTTLNRMKNNLIWLNKKIESHNSRWLVYLEIFSKCNASYLQQNLKNVIEKIKRLEQQS